MLYSKQFSMQDKSFTTLRPHSLKTNVQLKKHSSWNKIKVNLGIDLTLKRAQDILEKRGQHEIGNM